MDETHPSGPGPGPAPPLPEEEFESIFAKVPRLTVEVVLTSPNGVLLARRLSGPCRGLWALPGGTVRLGEPLTDAVVRVAREELDVEVATGRLLGYLEYPSHLRDGLGWPVGIAFAATLRKGAAHLSQAGAVEWFSALPKAMHEEQRSFLVAHGLGGD